MSTQGNVQIAGLSAKLTFAAVVGKLPKTPRSTERSRLPC